MNYTKNEKGFPIFQFARCLSFALIFGSLSIMGLNAQTMPAAQSLPYSQDFASLTGSGTPAFPAGWIGWTVSAAIPSSGGRTNAPTGNRVLTIGNANTPTGANPYDYNGKLGILSSSAADVTVCMALNTTNKGNIRVGFDAMTIRNPYDGSANTRIAGLIFQYRIGETGVFTTLSYSPSEYQTITTGQTTVTTEPQNLQTGYNVMLPGACSNQSVIQVRWILRFLSGGAGACPSIAIDNVSISAVPVTFTSGWPKAESPTASGFTAKSNINTPGTTYFVVLASGASAPSAAQVKAGQDAGSIAVAANEKGSITNAAGSAEYVAAVSGLSGNTTYDVYFIAEGNSALSLQSTPQKVTVTTTGSAVAPTITNPTATSITSVDATLGGEITSDGGSTITERGTVWKTTTGVTITDNLLAEGLTTTGVFSHSRIELPSKTQIFYKAYAVNAIGTNLTDEASFFTKAVEPTSAVGSFAANTIVDVYNSIDLSWTPATGADGYIILKRDGASAPGTAPSDLTNYTVGNSIGTGTVAAIVSSGATTSQVISGLTPGSQYTFRIYPFGYDGANAATMNYAPIALSVSATATLLVPSPTTYTWNQSGTASFATASNWTPTRTTTYSNDILQINTGGSVVLTGVSTQTIAQLSITNNTTVELQSASTATLTISGEAGIDFVVQAGSVLNITQASNVISVGLASGTTGTIGGSITFNTVAHRLTAVDASAITFQSGSTFTAGSTFSGNAFGTTSLNSVVFASGSTYLQSGGSNPFGASQPNAVAVFQTGSLLKCTGTAGPSYSGRTYANFEVDQSGNTQNNQGSGSATFDNFTVTNGTVNWDFTGGVVIKGNISIESGATLTFGNATNLTPVTFSGTGNQTITVDGTLTNGTNASYTIANSSGVNVASNISVPSVTLNASSILNVNAGKKLTVSTTLTNNGTLNLLSTSADGTATILTPATITGSGTASVQQFLTGGRNWYVSSPVTGANATTVLASSTATTKPTSFIWYDETKGSTTPWTSESSTLTVTKGYVAVNPSPASTDGVITFNGTLNAGAYSTGDLNPLTLSSTGVKDGFNLVGNPYPSYLDWNQATKTNLHATMWYRSNEAGTYKFYTYNGTAAGYGGGEIGVPANVSNLIPPMQAFWVKVEGGPGTLAFTNDMRSHVVGTNPLKSATQSAQQILRLEVSNAGNTDEAVV
ncbi:MAG: hypothetical protein NTY32_01525, partial [Bacteroidia bacterium]|nr:hypothetical protein [Bacteroidia bacterium]